MNSFKIKIRIVLGSLLAVSVLSFLYLKIVPFGNISYSYNLSGTSKFISELTPKDRLGDMTNQAQIIKGNPVYFNFNAPRGFDEAKLTILYRNTSHLDVIEAGILVDSLLWRYKTEPIENSIIDKLASEWRIIVDKNLIFLQKPEIARQYSDIDEFLNNPPLSEKIATYNYHLDIDYRMPDYQPQKDSTDIDVALLGDWQILTYIKGEELQFSFSFDDLNQNDDKDDINILLYYQDSLIESKTLIDDRGDENNRTISLDKTVDFDLASLPEGVYKIELRASKDIVTKNIKTKQSKFVFSNNLNLSLWQNGPELVTDSNQLQFSATDPVGLQEIKVEGIDAKSSTTTKSILVDQTYRQFTLDGLVGENILKLKAGDINIAGNGVFALSADAFFNPRLKQVDKNLDISSIDYIIANYQLTDTGDGWKSATVDFDMKEAYHQDDKYSFMISAPGLRADDELDDSFEIKAIKLDLYGKSIIEKLKSL